MLPRFALLFAVPLLAIACKEDAREERQATDSLLAAIPSVSESLQEKEDLSYRLLCAPERDGGLEEYAVLSVPKGDKKATSLDFTLKKVITIGSFCRIEVHGASPDTYAGDYEFPVAKDMFYASTKGEVEKAETGKGRLAIKVYKVYHDLKEDTQSVLSEITFPSSAIGKFALELVCGEKAYPASFVVTATDKIYTGGFNIPLEDLNDGLSCSTVRASSDNAAMVLEGKFSEAASIKRGESTTLVVTLVPPPPPTTSSIKVDAQEGVCKDGEIFNPAKDICEAIAPFSTP